MNCVVYEDSKINFGHVSCYVNVREELSYTRISTSAVAISARADERNAS